MKLLHAAAFAVLLATASMSAQAGKMAKSKEPLTLEPDKAAIVFMRPGKFVGAAVAVPVYDVTGDETRFIGILDAGSKVAYQVPAGEHVFMTTIFGGEAGVRFYKANVEAGKTYYFRAHIIEGIWGLEPVRQEAFESKDFASWDKGTQLTINSPKSLEWGQANLESASQRHKDLEPKAIADDSTLRVEDGR
ncbi:hypothetical protein [Pseudoxanthomonas mexicana]